MKWINIKTSKPEYMQTVLIITDLGFVTMAQFGGSNSHPVFSSGEVWYTATHWMPLPPTDTEYKSDWEYAIWRLPNPGEVVIVSGGIAYHDGTNWYSLTGIEYPGRIIQWGVTWWAPLPTGPKELNNKNYTNL